MLVPWIITWNGGERIECADSYDREEVERQAQEEQKENGMEYVIS